LEIHGYCVGRGFSGQGWEGEGGEGRGGGEGRYEREGCSERKAMTRTTTAISIAITQPIQQQQQTESDAHDAAVAT
jgi:hypothetical protein